MAAAANPLLGHGRRAGPGAPARNWIDRLSADVEEQLACNEVPGAGAFNGRLILQDMPERNLLLEAYALGSKSGNVTLDQRFD